MTLSPLRFWQADSFTTEPFKGNPAAVVVSDRPLPDSLMQNIAIEMNLSETAYILLRPGENPLLRWFTPTREIDLCGHATLAAAHVYLTEIAPEKQDVTFETVFVGPLRVTREKGAGGYRMDFPARPGESLKMSDVPAYVFSALTEKVPAEIYQSRDLMLVYDDATVIRSMTPDFRALEPYKKFIIVTAQSDTPAYDFISRFFCPDDVIVEDPVTGSAHCTSGPYWAKRLGKTKLTAYQASARGGALRLEVAGDRVLISGDVVTVVDGTLRGLSRGKLDGPAP